MMMSVKVFKSIICLQKQLDKVKVFYYSSIAATFKTRCMYWVAVR